METFTASNGIDVAWRDSDSGLRVLHTNAERCIAHVVPYPGWQVVGEANQNSSGSGFTETSETAKALREFFQYERDQELGRWRWPGDQKWVVYKHHSYLVINEEGGAATYLPLAGWSDIGTDPAHRAVLAAYEAAHPAPKPWHDAKPGEVWELERRDEIAAWGVVERLVHPNTFVDPQGRRPWFPVTDELIISARRIWPEVE